MKHFIAVLFPLVSIAPAIAADVEAREFQIQIDGKPAGTYTMTITTNGDGTIVQSGQANVRMRVLIKTFIYSYTGTETWNNGRLTKFESNTNDDGTRYQLRGLATERGLDFSVNGRGALAAPGVWPMSFWKLPPPDSRNGPVDLLEIDNGRLHKSQLTQVGKTKLSVDGKMIEARQFQVRGGAMADLWYDSSDRLLRHETVNQGHPTVLHLLRIRSNSGKP